MMTLVAATLLAAACSNEQDSRREDVPAEITANLGAPLLGRAMDAEWENDDNIGIFASVSANKDEQNWKYTYNSTTSKWTSERPFYFKETEDEETHVVNFKAYHPWKEGMIESGSIDVDAGTVNQTPEAQKTIDFLFADKPADKADATGPTGNTEETKSTGSRANPKVNFQFHHCMSKVEFTLVPSTDEGVSMDDVKALAAKLTGVKSKGKFSLTDGTVTVTEGTEATDVELTPVTGSESVTLSAIVVPQARETTADARLILTKKGEGADAEAEEFKTKNILNFELKAGTKYTYTIKVRKIALEILSSGISDWTTEDKGENDATLQ